MGTDCASASEAPQKRQNCAGWSEAPRHREQTLCIAGARLDTTSTTRAGAMGEYAGEGGGKGGGTDDRREGSSAAARVRFAVPVEGRGAPLATGGGEDAAGAAARRWPHVTQKRRPRWLALPQSAQAVVGVVAVGTVGCGAARGAKLTSGAGGR
jgi:hypothetical protein